MTLKPGEMTTLTLEFSMAPGMGGLHDFRIHLTTNDLMQPSQELIVLSNWIE